MAGRTHLDPAAARCRARPLDALAAGRDGAWHRGLFRAAERAGAVARTGDRRRRLRRGRPGAGRQQGARPVHRRWSRRRWAWGWSTWRTSNLAAPTHQPALVQHQCRGSHRRHPAPARRHARGAGGGAAQGQQRAAARDDAGAAAGVAEQGRAAAARSATASWCWPISRRPRDRQRRAPSISSGSPGTSSSARSAMRWRRRR